MSLLSRRSLTFEEFHECFWYFVLVTVACAYSCFQHVDVPTRFTFCQSAASDL